MIRQRDLTVRQTVKRLQIVRHEAAFELEGFIGRAGNEIYPRTPPDENSFNHTNMFPVFVWSSVKYDDPESRKACASICVNVPHQRQWIY